MKKFIIFCFLFLVTQNNYSQAYALFVFGPNSKNAQWFNDSHTIYGLIKTQLDLRQETLTFFPKNDAEDSPNAKALSDHYQTKIDLLTQALAKNILEITEQLLPTAKLSLVSYGAGVKIIQKAFIQLAMIPRGKQAFFKIKNVFIIEQEGFTYLHATNSGELALVNQLNKFFGQFFILTHSDFNDSSRKNYLSCLALNELGGKYTTNTLSIYALSLLLSKKLLMSDK